MGWQSVVCVCFRRRYDGRSVLDKGQGALVWSRYLTARWIARDGYLRFGKRCVLCTRLLVDGIKALVSCGL